MGGFPNRLVVSPLGDGVHWLLINPFSYIDDKLGSITSPAGDITDGGSIPKFFQNVISPVGKGFPAFVIHDALYKYKWFTREESDECLKRMLRTLGEVEVEVETIYEAVRMGGGAHWG